MGSSFQRLEVLAIGLIVLLAGAVVAVMMLLRPVSPSAYLPTTPQSIAGGAVQRPTSAPQQTTTVPPTTSPVATSGTLVTVVPVATNADEERSVHEYTEMTWVTRADVKVDRLASAWLIRRFIDPRARFAFTREKRHARKEGEVRFDMYDGEFTHEGERCTFETLMRRFGLTDPALRAIGEIVHDIDLKEERFGRPETAGVASMIHGITATTERDDERLRSGGEMLDGLYAHFQDVARG